MKAAFYTLYTRSRVQKALKPGTSRNWYLPEAPESPIFGWPLLGFPARNAWLGITQDAWVAGNSPHARPDLLQEPPGKEQTVPPQGSSQPLQDQRSFHTFVITKKGVRVDSERCIYRELLGDHAIKRLLAFVSRVFGEGAKI